MRRVELALLNRRAFALALCAPICAACGGTHPDARAGSAAIPPAATHALQTRGLYWSGLEGHGPWLIYLAQGSDSSGLYQPISSLALCDLHVDTGGGVSFRSARFGVGTEYRFAGRVSGSSLSGTMKRVTARTGVVEDSTLLTLRRVSATLAPGSGFLSGDYAEVRATEGSGDLSGTDLLLVDGGEGLVGVAVDYDGGPSEVRAVTGDRMNDLLHVTFQSTQRVETDTGAIHGDTILFYQGSVRLVRQSSLGSVFGGQNRQRCGAP